MRRSLFLFSLLTVGSFVRAAEYTFVAQPSTGTAQITVKLASPLTEFRLPAWAPGDYQIFDYGQFVSSIAFTRKGQPVPFERTFDKNLWRIPGGADRVVYETKPPRGNFSVNLRVTEGHTFVSGSGVFGWFEGDQGKKQTLRVWTGMGAVYSTLDRPPSAEGGNWAVYEAHDFDELIDAPFVVGTAIKAESLEVHGKTMQVVAFNRIENVDLSGFVRVGRAAAEATFKLFGELPFPRYIFFCDFGGGGGGLEHLNSTRLGLGPRAQGENAAGLIFHEFFHLYNVKRIREKPLGPFDYTKPAMTRTIWWLEGVTDYYADVLQVRAGLRSRAAAVGEWSASLAVFAQNPNRLKVSADEASLRVWEARGSYGFGGISYYEKGKLIGLCLDLAIRGQSGGKASLDDVMRQLFEECKNRKPGYAPERIRELCVKFGGPELGPIYDRCTKEAVDLPVADVARMAGLIWSGAGFAPDPMASAEAQAAGARWPLAASQ